MAGIGAAGYPCGKDAQQEWQGMAWINNRVNPQKPRIHKI